MSVDALEAMAAIDAAGAFTRFEPEELSVLRRYHRLCRAIRESTFFQQPVRFHFGVDGETLEHAGYDALRSMLADFRQLWMKREPTRFEKILELLRSHAEERGSGASAQAIIELDALAERNEEARSRPMMSFVDPDNPMKVIENVPAEQAIDDWLYSGPFHLNPKKASRAAVWGDTAQEYTVTKVAREYAVLRSQLDVVVQGILNTPQLSEPDG